MSITLRMTISLALVMALFTGCATTNEFLIPNADLIDQSIQQASNEIKDLGIKQGETISIAELVSKSTDNAVPSALIYDTLVQSLRNQGLSVVDRDRDSIRVIAPEVGEDAFPVTTKYLSMGIESASAWDAQVGTAESADVNRTAGGQNIIVINKTGADAEAAPVLARLPKSNYILFYRVLEAGVRYGKRDTTKSGEITRRARVMFNYRLIHTESAMVMKAGRVDTYIDDDIPKYLKSTLEKNLYVYFAHAHPDFLPAREVPLKVKKYTEISSNAKGSGKVSRHYYGFAGGLQSLSDQDTKNLAGPMPLEITFEMLHTVIPNVLIASSIGGGMGQEEKDGYTSSMWYAPIKVSALYAFDLGAFRPYVGGGIFGMYSEWTLESDFTELADATGDATLFGAQIHAGFKVSVFMLNLRYLFGSSGTIGGGFGETDVSFDGANVNIGLLF
jgi:hypothetical protein